MANFNSFTNVFLSYVLLLGIMCGLVVIACIIGIRWRKSKDTKALLEEAVVVEARNEE